MQIKSLGLNTNLVPVGVDEDGVMETPQNWYDAGWYMQGWNAGGDQKSHHKRTLRYQHRSSRRFL